MGSTTELETVPWSLPPPRFIKEQAAFNQATNNNISIAYLQKPDSFYHIKR